MSDLPKDASWRSDLLKDPSWRAGAQAMLYAMIDRHKLMAPAVRELLERLEAPGTTAVMREAAATIRTQDKRIAELEQGGMK